ncbi:MAG: hypothetical protein QXX36_01790 [Candidatus Rehaiarchaeum fermentans]|nr:hypothetical protein [Candidatus Rehaiarchaeum fermentans]MCW1297496.1 hypothetical protein [Candidatus Rehaiarchaeum fermentans]MCW1302337.1 hypothetical protein [Candidatus Rehaiarchaeum fermentans]
MSIFDKVKNTVSKVGNGLASLGNKLTTVTGGIKKGFRAVSASRATQKGKDVLKRQAGFKSEEEKNLAQRIQDITYIINNPSTSPADRLAAIQAQQLLSQQLLELKAKRRAILIRNVTLSTLLILFLGGISVIALAVTNHLGPFSYQFESVYGVLFNYLGSYISPIFGFVSQATRTFNCISNPLECVSQTPVQTSYSFPTFSTYNTITSYTSGEVLEVNGNYQYYQEVTDNSIYSENGCYSLYGDISEINTLSCEGQFCSYVNIGNPVNTPTLCPGGTSIVSNQISFSCPPCPNKNPSINYTFCQPNRNPFPLTIPLSQQSTVNSIALSTINLEIIDSQLYQTFLENQIPVPFSGSPTGFSTSGPVSLSTETLVPNPIISSSSGTGPVSIAIYIDVSEGTLNLNNSNLYVFIPYYFSPYGDNEWLPSGPPSTEGVNINLPSQGQWYVAKKSYLINSSERGLPLYFSLESSPPPEQLDEGLIVAVLTYSLTESYPSYVTVISPTNSNPCVSNKSISNKNVSL